MPEREIFWNVGDILAPILIYTLSAAAIVILALSIWQHIKRWRMGKPANRVNNIGRRVRDIIVYAIVDGILHRKFFRIDRKDPTPYEWYPGLAHWFIFLGFLALFLGAGIDAFSHYIYDINVGNFYLGYSLVTDGLGLLALVGIVMAVIRRYVVKPSRLDNKNDDLVALGLIFVIIVTGFIVEGLRMADTELGKVAWAPFSPGGYALALLFSGASDAVLRGWHVGMYWFHIALVIGSVLYVTRYNSRLYHIFWDPVNVFFRNLGPRSVLQPIDLEKAESFGASKIEDFTWKDLMDLDACTRCGRCQDNCPAHLSGKKLSPKKVIQDLKTHMYDVYPKPAPPVKDAPRKDMISEVVTDEVLWDCTTCRACEEACPIAVERIEKIIDMRRTLAMERSSFPESVQDALKCLGQRGHPYRGTTATRTDWTEGLGVKTLADDAGVDVLYWVGCSAALDERNMKVAKSVAAIMKAAGVNFGILGLEESCCGDPARRMGDEYLFQTLAQANIEILKNYNVKKIVTACPHCFNMLKNEYPQFGGSYEVVHHTMFIADLIRQGRIKLNGLDPRRIAYHDSCYLGRYNEIYAEPRQILGAIGGLNTKELPRHDTRSFCCGGGGGHMWMEEEPDKRLNTRRVDEIVATKVDMIATACPYCLVMFEDGIKAKGVEETVKARDLSEIVVESMTKGQTPAAKAPATPTPAAQ